ncbi:MAG TPA: amino acid adenylation domain-containing protein, partial [Candidatus Deferrimicrobium sp.]|nr:amino acid adenylation domain-containing protein [Candidatus Deferrimicrobium sp.]
MITSKFKEIVARFPGQIAVKTGGQSLTYTELNFRAGKVARAIAQIENAKKQQIALLFDYGSDMIVGLLGVLEAGKTYVPLDASYPGKRLLYILENSQTYLILTDKQNLPLAQELSQHAESQIDVLDITALEAGTPADTPTNVNRDVPVEKNAYILYTSGSTGKPKGVYQTHRNVLYYARNWIERVAINETDRLSLFTAFTHDGAIPDIYSGLLSGARLYPYSLKEKGNVAELAELLASEKITVWHSTPTLFRYFTGALTGGTSFPEVRRVLLGGEPLRAHDVELYKTFFPNASLINVYGQTESTVSSLCTIGPQHTFADISLGEPLDETKIFLINEYGEILDEMGGGEIVVASDYVAPGYWQDPGQTGQVFLHDEQQGRLYRTGDLGRFTAQGAIKIVGRKDFQVKIRGFRIELGEIETALLQHYAVNAAIVTARLDENNNDNYLCAYIVSSQAISSEDLREYLFAELPDYMVPRYFIFLEKMPLTSSGKIDRRQLPEPGKILDAGSAYVAPAGEIEEKVAAIWQEVLKIEKIGVNDNFTELGGHSLLIMTINAKIHQELNVELQLTDLFDKPTIRELSCLIKESKQTIFSAIEPVEEKEYYPLSSAQKRLYILQQVNPGSTAYNMAETIPLPAGYEGQKIEAAFTALINRHESLRTSFHMIAETPVQVVHDKVEFEIEQLSKVFGPTFFQKGGPPEAILKSFIRPFDLAKAPLLRVGLVTNSDGSYLLLVDMHHIISDGVSHEILVKDYQSLYKKEAMAPLRLQYKDFAGWQNSEKEKAGHKRQEEFWLKQFEGEIPVLELPTDYPRPVQQSFAGNAVPFEISAEETRALNAVALSENATLFMVLAAVLNILLAKLSGQEEIIVGTPIAGRRHADLEKIIGMFVNTLALRNYPVGGQTFREFLGDVKKRLLMVFENQGYPFEELVDKLSLKRDLGRNPLFDIMIVSQDMSTYTAGQDDEPGLAAHISPAGYQNINQTVRFDLTLSVMERPGGLFFLFQYCTQLFKKETIIRYIMYFKKIIMSIVKEPDIKISAVEIISEEEKKCLLVDFNKTEAVYPADKTIPQLFEEQASRTPDAIALVGADEGEEKKRRREEEKNVHLSYLELNEQAGHLAGLLIQKGVQPDTIVAIMMERSIDMVTGIYGILKAGGAYLPIDRGYPPERIEYMLKDSGVRWLVTGNDKEVEKVGGWEGEKIFLESIIYDSNHLFHHSSFIIHHSNHLAYLIYTSGSTGKPKGVMIEQRSVLNFISWAAKFYVRGERVNFPLNTSISFDLTVTSLFMPLLTGNTMVIYGEREEADKGLLIERIIEEDRVGVLKLTPSHFKIIRGKEYGNGVMNLKRLVVAGENLDRQLALDIHEIFKGKVELYNEYGPTETTVGCMIYRFDPGKDNSGFSVPIGLPGDNARAYILDKYWGPVPVNVTGELYIGGAGVARGYLNRPELTAEKFINKSFWGSRDLFSKRSLAAGGILYRTGDLCRWLANGNIEFLGRCDEQVKIRGFRIELGEIEIQLTGHPRVKQAVVVPYQNKEGDKILCAYVVLNNADSHETIMNELRAYLLKTLP